MNGHKTVRNRRTGGQEAWEDGDSGGGFIIYSLEICDKNTIEANQKGS